MGVFKNTSNNHRVSMPWSPPWNAPEVHRDNYVLPSSEAKLSDVFSLGMVCLWLLFQNGDLAKSERGVQGEYDWLRALKKEGKLKCFACDRIDGDRNLGVSRKHALKEFFALTLSAEPGGRSEDFDHLLRLLDRGAGKSEDPHIPMIPDPEQRLVVEEPLFEVMAPNK
jgi:hypothetical protein